MDRRACSQDMRNKLGLLTLYNRTRFLRFLLIIKIVNNVTWPEYHTYLLVKASIIDILGIERYFIYLRQNSPPVRVRFSSLQQGIGTVFPKNSGKLVH